MNGRETHAAGAESRGVLIPISAVDPKHLHFPLAMVGTVGESKAAKNLDLKSASSLIRFRVITRMERIGRKLIQK